MAGEGKYAEAERLLLKGYTGMKDNRWVSADHRQNAIGRLIQLYEFWGKPDQVSEWRRLLEDMPEASTGEN